MKIHPLADRWAVTGPFGATTDPWTPDRPHLGVDYGAPKQTPVRAPADGVSVTFSNDGSFGARSVCLHINSDPKYPFHLFAHLNARMVEVGDRVKAGQVIGFVGGWGMSGPDHYGPHLHWQRSQTNLFRREPGENADPLEWLNQEEPVTRDEFEKLEKRVAAVETVVDRIDNRGIVLYTDGQGYDVVQPIRDLNARLTEHLEETKP